MQTNHEAIVPAAPFGYCAAGTVSASPMVNAHFHKSFTEIACKVSGLAHTAGTTPPTRERVFELYMQWVARSHQRFNPTYMLEHVQAKVKESLELMFVEGFDPKMLALDMHEASAEVCSIMATIERVKLVDLYLLDPKKEGLSATINRMIPTCDDTVLGPDGLLHKEFGKGRSMRYLIAHCNTGKSWEIAAMCLTMNSKLIDPNYPLDVSSLEQQNGKILISCGPGSGQVEGVEKLLIGHELVSLFMAAGFSVVAFSRHQVLVRADFTGNKDTRKAKMLRPECTIILVTHDGIEPVAKFLRANGCTVCIFNYFKTF